MSTAHNIDAPIETQPARSATHYTTLWGGAGIIVASVLMASPSLLPIAPIEWYFLSGWLPVLQILSTVMLAAAVFILALGVRSETGIVGSSVVGKVALIGFGVLRVLLAVLPSSFPIALDADTMDLSTRTVLGYVNTFLYALPLIAALVAGLVVVRVGVLHGVARWGLLGSAAANLMGMILLTIPVVEVMSAASLFYSASLLLMLALGIALMLSGQSEALRKRWKIINDAW